MARQPVETFSLTLRVRDLAVARGGRPVASGLSFSLSPGAAMVVRGGNGTGKTSLLRAIAGLSRPTGGAIQFLKSGRAGDAEEVRATDIHWLGGEDGLADRLTVAETLGFWSALYGGGPFPPVLEQIALGPLSRRRVGALSTGQRRRLGLGRLLVARRALWLLDEPQNGLDAEGRKRLSALITRHRAHGGIVVMASDDDGLPAAPVLTLRAMEAA